jgi:hypothetical protein
MAPAVRVGAERKVNHRGTEGAGLWGGAPQVRRDRQDANDAK